MEPLSAILGLMGFGANVGLGFANFGLQSQAFAYQQWLNQMQMGREDDAIQRRVRDLRAAKLSPVLAAGSAASSAPLRAGTAPQLDIDVLKNIGGAFGIESMRLSQEEQRKNIANKDSQNALINAQVEKTKQDIEFMKENNPLRIQKLKNEVDYQLSTMDQRVRRTNMLADTEQKRQDLIDAQRYYKEHQIRNETALTIMKGFVSAAQVTEMGTRSNFWIQMAESKRIANEIDKNYGEEEKKHIIDLLKQRIINQRIQNKLLATRGRVGDSFIDDALKRMWGSEFGDILRSEE